MQFQDKQKSLADKFEYVMHGLLYKMSEDTSDHDPAAYVFVKYKSLCCFCECAICKGPRVCDSKFST